MTALGQTVAPLRYPRRRQCTAHTDAPAAALPLQAYLLTNPAAARTAVWQNPIQHSAARGRATPFAQAALVPPFSPVAASQEQFVVRHTARDGTGEVVLIVT